MFGGRTSPPAGPPDARSVAPPGWDAAPADAAVVDATGVDAAPPDARRVRPPRKIDAAPVALAAGTLKVGAKPWAEVYLDGKKLGRAPGSWLVPAGEHEVVVKFPVPGREQSRTFRVTIEEGAAKNVGLVDFTR